MERYNDLNLLVPRVRGAFSNLVQDLDSAFIRGQLPVRFLPFETYRSPERQQAVYNAGNSKAVPWRSPHNFGLAVDFVAFHDGKWSWADTWPWGEIRARARRYGLDAPIVWDRGHVEHPLWNEVRALMVL